MQLIFYFFLIFVFMKYKHIRNYTTKTMRTQSHQLPHSPAYFKQQTLCTLCTCTFIMLSGAYLSEKKPSPPPKKKKKKIRKKNKIFACQHIFLAWPLIYIDLREKYVEMREKCLCQHALIDVEMQDIYYMLTCNLSLSTSCTWTH